MDSGVALVDGDAMARAWICTALEPTEFAVVLERPSTAGLTAALSARAHGCLLVLENRLAGETGLDAVRELRVRGCRAPALLMSATVQPGLNEAARAAGAQGTLLKTGEAAGLVAALRALAAGEPSFDRRHPPLSAGQTLLSAREREILRLVAQGATNEEIGARLGLSRESVKTLLSRAFRKLGVGSRTEAVSTAYRKGIL